MTEPAFVAETLAWCNEIRAAQGKPPLDRLPKGKRADPKSCPCGTATGADVAFEFYYLPRDRKEYSLPEPVRKFVRAFDQGMLLQYVENEFGQEGGN
jgi:hypothetical protein